MFFYGTKETKPNRNENRYFAEKKSSILSFGSRSTSQQEILFNIAHHINHISFDNFVHNS